MKSVYRLSTALLLLSFATVIYAQTPAGGGGGGGIIASFGEGPGSQGLKGAPFSADITNVMTRTLADGNRITRETHGKTFRDSEGRTRRENEFDVPDGTKRVNVTISDPVQHVMIILDSATKMAIVHHLRLEGPIVDRPSLPAAAPQSAAAATAARQPTFEKDSLGTKEIEGFTVTGSRISRTIEAGRIGNEKPIVILNEAWFSQDLKINLLTKRDDPQTGQSTMTISNIHTGEPDPQLFQVPADYTVKDNP